jgi:hypothetical protein
MPTIYGNFPILLPGKTETIYPSGLKKISGTVVSLESTLPSAKSLMQSFGSVWPKPETRKTENGWLEIPFSAYSQDFTTDVYTGLPVFNAGSSTLGVNLVVLSKTFSQEFAGPPQKNYNWTITETWLVDVLSLFTTLPSSSKNYPALSTAQQSLMSSSLRSRKMTGNPAPGAVLFLNLQWTNEIVSVSRSNFGSIDEIQISYQRTALVA